MSSSQEPPQTPTSPRGYSPTSFYDPSSISSSSFSARRKCHPAFPSYAHHLSRTLAPLVSLTTGEIHPAFPRSILQYQLLTSKELDDLALFYHQIEPPLPETGMYPAHITPWIGERHDGTLEVYEDVSIETKRRRWGRFIGLRGCESPVSSSFSAAQEERSWRRRMMCRQTRTAEEQRRSREVFEKELHERMEREWGQHMEKKREPERDGDRMLFDKAQGWY